MDLASVETAKENTCIVEKIAFAGSCIQVLFIIILKDISMLQENLTP